MPNPVVPAALAELIATHRSIFGGSTMMADDASVDEQADQTKVKPRGVV